jgi:LCP family protein required for cell wall assembly
VSSDGSPRPRGTADLYRLTEAQTELLARLTSRGSLVRVRRGPSLLRRLLVVAVAFTGTLVLCGASIAGYFYHHYNGQLHRVTVLKRSDPNIRQAARQLHAENFLVIGSDSRAGLGSRYGHVAGARSDTTILVHLSPDHTRATVISIPRDSWVDIPACTGTNGQQVPAHQDMFNAAFSIGGPACTIATVQKLTGIAVTHFVEIDFSGFQRVVDALGTVTVCSPQAVDDPKSTLHLTAGENHLDGVQALAYVRARETLGDGSDLGRIKRQQMFLGTVLRQALTGSLLADPSRLTSFLDAVTRSITVDRDTSLVDLRELALSLHGLDPRRVAFYTAPIANRDYSPPGTGLSGKVLLDPTQGRILYDAVINDRAPTTPGTPKATPTTGPAKKAGSGPKPDLTAAQHTCSL